MCKIEVLATSALSHMEILSKERTIGSAKSSNKFDCNQCDKIGLLLGHFEKHHLQKKLAVATFG